MQAFTQNKHRKIEKLYLDKNAIRNDNMPSVNNAVSANPQLRVLTLGILE